MTVGVLSWLKECRGPSYFCYKNLLPQLDERRISGSPRGGAAFNAWKGRGGGGSSARQPHRSGLSGSTMATLGHAKGVHGPIHGRAFDIAGTRLGTLAR